SSSSSSPLSLGSGVLNVGPVGRGRSGSDISSLTRTTSHRYWAGSVSDPDSPVTPVYHERKRNKERKTLAAGNATVEEIKVAVLRHPCCTKLKCTSRFTADEIHAERKKIHSAISQIDRRIALIKYIDTHNAGSVDSLMGRECCQFFWFRAMGVSQRLLRRAVARDDKPHVRRGGTQPLSAQRTAVVGWLADQAETGDRQPDLSEIHLHGNSKLSYLKKYREESIEEESNLPYVCRSGFYRIWASDAPRIKVKRQVQLCLHFFSSHLC